MVSPPYSAEFVQLFLPMVESDEITGSYNKDHSGEMDNVNEFIGMVFPTHILKILSILWN